MRPPCLVLLIVLAALLGPLASVATAQKDKELGAESLIFVGTTTTRPSAAKGIYAFRMRTSDDPNIPEFVTVKPLGLVAEASNPTFLAVDGKHRRLFCVNEVDDFQGGKSGAVTAYALDPRTAKLTLLNQRPSMGAGPCHLALDRDGKRLLVANGRGAGAAIFAIGEDGKLNEGAAVTWPGQYEMTGGRVGTSKPVGVAFSPDGRFAFVCDEGLDRIAVCGIDPDTGKLTPLNPLFTPMQPAAGPRRIVFRSDGKTAYVLNGRISKVAALSYDAKTGALTELQALSTVPEYFDGQNTAAEIAVHPSGKNLLVSNCGHHSVVLFTIDPDSGKLTYVEDQSTYGTMPVHFGMDAAGHHVVVANRESGSILILRAPENARVKPAGNIVPTPSPTCAIFLPPDAK